MTFTSQANNQPYVDMCWASAEPWETHLTYTHTYVVELVGVAEISIQPEPRSLEKGTGGGKEGLFWNCPAIVLVV